MALIESLPSGPNEIGIEDEGTPERTEASEAASEASETELPGPHLPEGEHLVTIGRYFTPVEAHGCRMALENSGIPAWVLDETVGATFQVGVGTRLQVLARDEGAARAVLKEEPGPASSSSPDVDPDVEEPPDPAIEETRGRGAPAEEPPLFGNGGRLLTVETIELVAVVLITSAYPILSRLLGEPDDQRIRRGPLAAEILWFVGQTCVVWLLLRRKQGPLSPKPLPNSAYGWTMESALGLVLFAAVWALHSWLAPVLAGLPHPPSPWAAFFREPGVAPIFAASAFFAAVYEEVVFRAYFVSRLPLLLGGHRVLSVLAAAALFALNHGYPLRSTLLVFADGVVYGLVYLNTRSLPRLVAAHWIYNLAAMSQYLRGR